MKKILLGFFAIALALTFSANVVLAEETSTSTDDGINLTPTQMEFLINLIDQLGLKLDISDLIDRAVRHDVKQDVKEIREFAMDMYEGLSSEDISDLQEILSGYSDIYPEGIVSGYFGSLTKQAVKRFQKKLGIDDTGYVGPLTRRALNDLMDDGQITAEEQAVLPSGIRNGRGLEKPLPSGIFKNLKERRGFAKGLNFGWDDDDSDEDDDSDDDSGDDSDEDEYTKESAQDAIDDAEEAINEAQAEIETLEDEDLIVEAEEFLAEAQKNLDDAEEEFDDKNWEEAETLARRIFEWSI